MRLIGPALLIFFLWRSNPIQLLEDMRGLALWPILVSLAMMPLFVVVKVWRWNVVMRELGTTPPPFLQGVVLYTIGLYAGGITPGQSGDFVKAWYLRSYGIALPTALFSIVLDRLFDFVVMAGLALIGLVVVLDVFPPDMQAPLQTATLIFALVIFLLTPLLMARGPREWLMNLAGRILPRGLGARLEHMREQFAPLTLRPGPLAQLLLASAGSAATTLLRIYLLFLTLPLGNIPALAIVGSTALIAILQALPISFAGVGVRDAVLIALLRRYGHTDEQALLLSAQFLLLNIEHILIGFLVSLRVPLKREGDLEALPQTDSSL
jgi:uncharacterized protein (TIRG00374 family)